ncbi:MAG: hypothetical protein M1820_007789 [Bogoriella megaspora]|nr:MAG: hypothetical protein M1820_007789 [Bogoriella megaspora]
MHFQCNKWQVPVVTLLLGIITITLAPLHNSFIGLPIWNQYIKDETSELALATRGHQKSGLGNLTRRSVLDGWPPTADISDNDWNTLVSRGQELITLMAASQPGADALTRGSFASQSRWADPLDMPSYGWRYDYDLQVGFDWRAVPIQDTISSLGFSTDETVPSDLDDRGHPWHPIQQWNSAQATVEGSVYPASFALYETIYNIQQGAIISYDSRSPSYNGPRASNFGGTDTNGPYTPLSRWSDITFLTYKELAAAQGNMALDNLRTVVVFQISEGTNTQLVIKRILEARIRDQGLNTAITDYSFKWNAKQDVNLLGTAEGQALLGTPIGAGVAWLLIQHKQALGTKITPTAHIFQDIGGEDPEDFPRPPSIVFDIVDSIRIVNAPWQPAPNQDEWPEWMCHLMQTLQNEAQTGDGA